MGALQRSSRLVGLTAPHGNAPANSPITTRRRDVTLTEVPAFFEAVVSDDGRSRRMFGPSGRCRRHRGDSSGPGGPNGAAVGLAGSWCAAAEIAFTETQLDGMTFPGPVGPPSVADRPSMWQWDRLPISTECAGRPRRQMIWCSTPRRPTSPTTASPAPKAHRPDGDHYGRRMARRSEVVLYSHNRAASAFARRSKLCGRDLARTNVLARHRGAGRLARSASSHSATTGSPGSSCSLLAVDSDGTWYDARERRISVIPAGELIGSCRLATSDHQHLLRGAISTFHHDLGDGSS